VLLVMTDDVGFGASSTFGGPIPTPNLDRLAAHGLRYNDFHTTAICSASRASLLTGRNHHRVGYGNLADVAAGYPGYDAFIPRSAATIARILRDNGYSTAFFGKDHNVPAQEAPAAGPFDQWPTGLGFDYFFGFVGGDVDQWQPRLFRGTSRLPDSEEASSDLLDKRLADDAISWLHNQNAAAPSKPFFIYLAPGSTHAPHQAPADLIAHFHGAFDQGWDRLREETFARQKALGVIPQSAKLTPRPAEVPAWDSLSPELKRVNAHAMEAYAAQLAYEDAQFGRLIDELQRMGQLDNTLVIFIEGDNGASAEAGPRMMTNEIGRISNRLNETDAQLIAAQGDIGGPKDYGNYSGGWAYALDTPFQWF
jgi:arylsulfatase